MEDQLRRWLYDPTIGKMIATVVALIVLYVLVRFMQRSVSRYIKETVLRYRV